MKLNKLNNLQQRIIAGLIGAAILISGTVISEWTYFLVFFAITLLSLIEFFQLLKKSSLRANSGFGITAGLFIYILFFLVEKEIVDFQFLYLIFPLLFLLFIIELFKEQTTPFATIGYTFLGIIYIAIPFGLLHTTVYLFSTYSWQIILGILLLLWGNDIGGYIAGKTMGRHKLFQRISPKKTWEGSIGGGILSLLVAFAISTFMTDLHLINWIVIAFIIIVFGSYGDLVESSFKRSISIKDSGGLIPGHGGFLDRFDGLLLASPFIISYLKLFA